MNSSSFYIDGQWQEPATSERQAVFNPSTEEQFTETAWASADEVDQAVMAARRAFPSWSTTDPSERVAALERLIAVFEARADEMAVTISEEMGAPLDLSRRAQAPVGLGHLKTFAKELAAMEFTRELNGPEHLVALEAAGVAALITPWNWPMNQICLKVGAAMAAGCTMVLKPSEIAPVSAALFAEFCDEADIPAGVFNLIQGDGAGTGTSLTSHPEVDLISFTGSTRAGMAISKAAADTVKRVSLELGGKSPNVIFADSGIEASVPAGVGMCFNNTGQSCISPTRMLVEDDAYDEAVELAAAAANATEVNVASEEGRHLGPLVSEAQFNKVQHLIQVGIDEGARLVAGGVGRPEGLDKGWFVRPTVFADVTPDMTIWHEEIFGPVLAISKFASDEQAAEMANDTPYGLAAYIQGHDRERVQRLARQIRAGVVQINGSGRAPNAPFGGYKQSGNGREGGRYGIEDFLEVKSLSGWPIE